MHLPEIECSHAVLTVNNAVGTIFSFTCFRRRIPSLGTGHYKNVLSKGWQLFKSGWYYFTNNVFFGLCDLLYSKKNHKYSGTYFLGDLY